MLYATLCMLHALSARVKDRGTDILHIYIHTHKVSKRWVKAKTLSAQPISSVLIDMQHFALSMSLYEYVIAYTAIDHIVQTSARHCLVTHPPTPHPSSGGVLRSPSLVKRRGRVKGAPL